jgi:release factor glutamine methyltransferase
LAKKNALTHQIKNISFLRSDLLTSLDPSYYSKINLIVSNPPYIDKAIYKNLLPLTRKQPKNALLASSKGLYFYQKIFQQIQKFNQKKILLLFEIDYQKREELKKLAYDNFPSAFVEFFFDYSKKERVMSIVRNFSE